MLAWKRRLRNGGHFVSTSMCEGARQGLGDVKSETNQKKCEQASMSNECHTRVSMASNHSPTIWFVWYIVYDLFVKNILKKYCRLHMCFGWHKNWWGICFKFFHNSYHIEAKTKWTIVCRRHFKCASLNENVSISNKIVLKFVPKGPIYTNAALIQIMSWRRTMMALVSDAYMRHTASMI